MKNRAFRRFAPLLFGAALSSRVQAEAAGYVENRGQWDARAGFLTQTVGQRKRRW